MNIVYNLLTLYKQTYKAMILENGIEVSCLLSVQCCTELKKIHSVNVRHPHYD